MVGGESRPATISVDVAADGTATGWLKAGTETYLLQLKSDASGRLAGEAKLGGKTFTAALRLVQLSRFGLGPNTCRLELFDGADVAVTATLSENP
jgi:hypothetical protein